MELLLRIWKAYPTTIEFLLYFLVFAAISRAALIRVFPPREGKALSIALGLVLAGGLKLMQKSAGSLLLKIGPAALLLFVTAIFALGFHLFRRAGLPFPLIGVLTVFLALVLLRATVPHWTDRYLQSDFWTISLLFTGLLVWIWHLTGNQADLVENRKPGQIMARSHLLPNEDDLDKETRFFKRRILKDTKRDLRDERHIEQETGRAQRIIEKVNPPGNDDTRRAIESLESSIEKSEVVRGRVKGLLDLAAAMERFDIAWFKRTSAIHLNELSPKQQEILRKTFADLRARLDLENKCRTFELQAKDLSDTLSEQLRKAKDNLQQGNQAGFLGMMEEVHRTVENLHRLEAEVRFWEHRILVLIRDQHRHLIAPNV